MSKKQLGYVYLSGRSAFFPSIENNGFRPFIEHAGFALGFLLD
jgi:hypothetical protein